MILFLTTVFFHILIGDDGGPDVSVTTPVMMMDSQSVTMMDITNCQTNITAQTGLTASLFCCLGTNNKELGISWVRRTEDDMNIISHNSIMFTTDSRYSVHFYPLSGIWELRIGMLRLSDRGEYDCHANSEPRKQFRINLNVEDTVAVISGPKEVFLKAGSQLRLHCVVNLGDQGPDEHFHETAVLHWFLGQRLIDSTHSKEKEKGVTTRTRLLDNLEGWLTVNNSTPAYSGNYSCVPSYTTPDWVNVHVIKDDSPVGLLGVNHGQNCLFPQSKIFMIILITVSKIILNFYI